jgi:hypothetical protein
MQNLLKKGALAIAFVATTIFSGSYESNVGLGALASQEDVSCLVKGSGNDNSRNRTTTTTKTTTTTTKTTKTTGSVR